MNAVDLTVIWPWIGAVFYGVCAVMLYRAVFHGGRLEAAQLLSLLIVAAAAHGFALSGTLFKGAALNSGPGVAMSFMAWVMVVLYGVTLIREPAASLGLIVIPFALVSVLASWQWPGPPVSINHPGATAIAHALTALAAYALLALAFCQALLLLAQEWRLHHHRHSGNFFHALPPLEWMERTLFKIVALGFALLTVTLASGTLFSNQLFGRPFTFSHHVVLSIIAWVAFGTLLALRLTRGWRGRMASIWTIGSFAVLVLAYFGTRFVVEVVLKR